MVDGLETARPSSRCASSNNSYVTHGVIKITCLIEQIKRNLGGSYD